MNKIYKVVWNSTLDIWQCVPEIASAKGKSKSNTTSPAAARPTLGRVRTLLSTLILLAMGTISYQAAAETVTIEGAPGISGTVAQRTAANQPVGSISTAGKVMNDKIASRQSATIKGDTITIDGSQGATNTGIVKFIYEMGWGTDSNNSPINHNTNPDAPYFRYLKLDNSHLSISNPTSSPEGKFRFDGLYAGAEADDYTNQSTITLNNAEVLLNNSSTSGGLAVGPNSSVDLNNSTFTSIFVRNIGTVNVTGSTLAVTQDVTTFEGFSKEEELKGKNVDTAQLGTFIFDNGVLESKFRAARPDAPGMFKGNLVLKNDTEIKVDSRKTFIQGGGVISDNNGAKSAVNITGGGTLVYTSANTYTGNTNVKAGTLQLGNEGGNDIDARVVLNEKDSANPDKVAAANKQLDELKAWYANLPGGDGTTGDLANASNIILSQGTTLQIKRSGTYELDNQILAENGDESGGEGNLVQAGSGTTIVSNKANTFSGDIAIRGGVLQFENIESMGKGKTTISTGIADSPIYSFNQIGTLLRGEDGEPIVARTEDKKGKLKINFTEDATIERNIDGTGEVEKTNTAKVTYTGSGTYTGKTTVSGGELEIASGGSIIGTSEVIIDDGKTYTEGQPVATLTVGGTLETANPDNNYGDVTIDNGTLNVKSGGTVNVGNIKSKDAKADDQDKSTVTIEDGGNLTTNLVSGDKLFENFKTNPGHEGIQVDGTLTAQVADKDATISQEDGAVFTGAGSFVKDGNGTLKLASGNTIGTTWVKDGTLDLDPDKTLKSTTVKVGDNKVADATNKEDAKTATFNVAGTVTGATDVSVDSDGYLKLGDADNKGSISTTNLTVDGGSVDIVNGTTDVTGSTNINDGSVNVSDNGVLTSASIAIGDNPDNTPDKGAERSASLNVTGQVTATNVTVNPDGYAQVGKDGNDGNFTATNLTLEGGSVDVDTGNLATTTTKINDGTINVNDDGNLTATDLTVGNSDGDAAKDAAKLNVKGSVAATTVNVKNDATVNVGENAQGDNAANGGTLTTTNINVDGGTVNVNEGTTTATTTNVNDGTVNVDSGATLTTTNLKAGDKLDEQGTGQPINAFVNVNGTLEATGDITINKDAKVAVGTAAEGDNPAVEGMLKGNNLVLEGGEVDVVKGTAEITTDTDVKDGTLNVDKDATLTTTNLKAGDNSDDQNTGEPINAHVNIAGTVEASGDITVKPDAKVNVGTDAEGNNPAVDGTLKGNNLVLEGGEVNVVEGKAEITTDTDVKDGTLNVDKGATLTTNNLKAGDDSDDQNTGEPINAHVNIAGTVEASGDITVKPDAKVNVGTDAEGNNPAVDGTLKGNNLVLEGGEVNVVEGKAEIKTDTDVKDGTLNVDKDATLTTTNLKAGDDSDDQNTGEPINAHVNIDGAATVSGEMTVKPDAAVNVGTNDTPANGDTPATVGDTGSLTVNTFTMDGGTLDVNKGKLDAGTATVNDGTLTVDGPGTVNVGTVNPDTGDLTTPKALTLNGGTLDVAGKVNAENVVSNAPTTDDVDAVIKVREDGTLALKPTGDKPLFDGFKQGDSDTIEVGGKLAVDTADGVNAEQNPDAPINPLTTDSGTVKGTLEKTGDGSLLLSAPENTLGKTLVNDGTLGIKPNSVLNSDTVDVGDSQETSDTAKLNIEGGLKATDVNVKPDGHLNIGTNADPDAGAPDVTGKLETTNLTVDGGSVDLNVGDADIDTTQINKGTVTVDKGTTFNSDNINVGNNTNDNGDPASEAGIQIDGTVEAKNVTVNPDGTLDVGTNDKTQTGTLNTDKLVLEGGPANINSGEVNTPNDIVVNGTTLTIDEGATVTTPNVVTTDPIDDDTKASRVDVAGTLNLSPADGAKLFDGFQTNPARTPEAGKDGINIDGTLNLDIPSNATVSQDPDSGIAGSGVINKDGKGTFEVKADNPFEGTTNVNEGTLQIVEGGKLGNSQVNVKKDATLAVDKQGTQLGGLDLSDGGTLSIIATPKDGYTQIEVKGDVNLNNGKLFTDVQGHKAEEFANTKFPKIVSTTDGKVKGNFASYDDNSDLFDFIPQISSGEVYVIPQATPEEKPEEPTDGQVVTIAKLSDLNNTVSMANALDTIFERDPSGEISRLFYATRKDEIAGILPGFLPVFSGDTSRILGQTSQRLIQLAGQVTQCDYHRFDSERRAWGRGYGSWTNQQEYSGAPGYHADGYGAAVGVEICRREQRLGIMFGYANDRARSYGLLPDQKLRAQTFQVGVYGSKTLREDTDLDFKAGLGYSKVETERKVTFTDLRAEGSYGNHLAYVGLMLKHHTYQRDKLVLNPYVQADYQLVHNNSYVESGAKTFNLHVYSGNNHSLIAKLGLEGKVYATEKLTIHTDLGIGYNILGRRPTTVASFEAAPDTSFTTTAIGVGLWNAQAGVKLKYQVRPSTELSVGYDATISTGYFQHSPNLSLKVRF